MGKVLEKVIAEQLSELSENFLKLHQGQIGAQKERCAIDAVVLLVNEVEQKWAQKKLAAALFMDVKGAFDCVKNPIGGSNVRAKDRWRFDTSNEVVSHQSKAPTSNRRPQ